MEEARLGAGDHWSPEQTPKAQQPQGIERLAYRVAHLCRFKAAVMLQPLPAAGGLASITGLPVSCPVEHSGELQLAGSRLTDVGLVSAKKPLLAYAYSESCTWW